MSTIPFRPETWIMTVICSRWEYTYSKWTSCNSHIHRFDLAACQALHRQFMYKCSTHSHLISNFNLTLHLSEQGNWSDNFHLLYFFMFSFHLLHFACHVCLVSNVWITLGCHGFITQWVNFLTVQGLEAQLSLSWKRQWHWCHDQEFLE